MKYLSQLVLLVFPLLLLSSQFFAVDEVIQTEEEKSKQAIAQEECT